MKRLRMAWTMPVSYTHLDVYKRQVLVRFPDILDNRIEKVSCCFRQSDNQDTPHQECFA